MNNLDAIRARRDAATPYTKLGHIIQAELSEWAGPCIDAEDRDWAFLEHAYADITTLLALVDEQAATLAQTIAALQSLPVTYGSARLRDDIPAMIAEVRREFTQQKETLHRMADMPAELHELRAALAWYADAANYGGSGDAHPEGGYEYWPKYDGVEEDGGARARAALVGAPDGEIGA